MIVIPTPDDAKTVARRLRRALADRGDDPGHSGALELVAQAYGLRDWNTLAATAPPAPLPPAQTVVPILRIFNWPAARAFYVDYLSWRVDWRQQPGDHLPIYAQVSGPDGARVHLSEHHGDGTPGSAVLIEVGDVAALHADLRTKDYGYARPGLRSEEWGRTMTVHDPFGNRISYLQPAGAPSRVADQLPPITTTIRAPLPPDAAFARFTSFSWWRRYGLEDGGHVAIDNGEVVFHNPSGDLSIGRVTAWEPGRRYAQTFTLAQDPDHPSTLEARFTADGDGTVIQVDHGGWDAANADRRAHFSEWPIILKPLAQ